MLVAIGGAALALAGCSRPTEDHQSAPAHGRYLGVGLFPPGPKWASLVRSQPAASPAASAQLRDDEQIIVVVDSTTGEVRQCGNLSGYCIRMNPWSTELSAAQAAPVSVTKPSDPPAAAPK